MTSVERQEGPERLDVLPLLKAYRDAIALSRKPPASLGLLRILRPVHMRLRPTWMCHYFTTRYVRRRTDALERALAVRTALGDADDDDHAESEAVARFKASLPPLPSRVFYVAVLIAVLVVAQAAANHLFDLLGDTGAKHIEQSFGKMGPDPDVQSFGDAANALLSANYLEHGVILLALTATLYVFGRPLAFGYRLSYLCLGRAERLGRLRRRSPLCQEAGRLDTTAQEHAAAVAARARFRRDAPVDLLVKTLPWLVVVYLLVGTTRFDGAPDIGVAAMLTWALVALAAVAAIRWAIRSLTPRVAPPAQTILRATSVGLSGVAIVGGFFLITGFPPNDPMTSLDEDITWLVVAGLILARFAWLASRARSRGYPAWWIALPLVVTCLLAAVSPYDPYAVGVRLGHQHDHRGAALQAWGLSDVPQIPRPELQLMLATHARLDGSDLRTQDLHGLWLAGKQMTDAHLALANLTGAGLAGADLRGADLTGVVASGALMRSANLSYADLRCADLSGSDLRGADLAHAHLRRALLAFAFADETTRWPVGFHPEVHGLATGKVDPAFEAIGEQNADPYEYASTCRVS